MDWGAKWDMSPAAITGKVARTVAVPALHVAGRVIVADVKKTLGVEGYGVPSKPGQPPHKQTGELQASVSYEVDKKAMAVKVFVDHPAAFYLEFGTRTMAARPFLFPELLEYASRYGASHFRGYGAARHSPVFYQDII